MTDLKKEKFDIIIQAGQSNAEGFGTGPSEEAFYPDERILYLTNEKIVETLENGLKIEFLDKQFSIDVAKERGGESNPVGDFSLTFANNYVKNGFLKEGRKLLIVRAAVGGTGFYKKHWGLNDILYIKMIEMVDYALKLNPENKVVGMLWHQGEHDAFEGNPPEIFSKQLIKLICDIRLRYGENLPFIAGDFCYEWKEENIDKCTPIIDAIKAIVEKDNFASFVETRDLLSNNQKNKNGDNIHFCRESLMVLGKRYFDALSMINKQK